MIKYYYDMNICYENILYKNHPMFGLFLPLSQKSLVTFRLTQTIIQYVENNIVKLEAQFTSAMFI